MTATAAAAAGAVTVEQAWARPAAAGTNGAAFMTVVNHGKAAETLVAVETAAARKAELHQSTTAGGVMRMRPAPGVPIPAGGSARFAPGGAHVMLLGLKAALRTGDKVPAVLVFASGTRTPATFVVGAAIPKAATHAHH